MTEDDATYPQVSGTAELYLATLPPQIGRVLARVREYELYLPAVAWVANPLWSEAQWCGTSYQFDKADECPPVMGLKFKNWEKGQELFRAWIDKNGNEDELDEIRITVIEDDIPGNGRGYFIHIGADPENSMIRATAEGIIVDAIPLALFGQVQRMYPSPGTPPMLPRFKEVYQKHGEFLFAPVIPRDDGRLWVDLPLGIVKREIHFKRTEEVETSIGDAVSVLLKNVDGKKSGEQLDKT
jgi:hypothetical protein